MSKILELNDPLGKSLHIGSHIFPGIWRYAMPPEFLSLRFPQERRTTCMNCPKSCYESYRKDYRCCTYHPRIPNFLLGLAWDEGSARKEIQKVMDEGMLTPEGMNGTPQQWLDYLADVEYDRFGKSEKVLCPMLDRSNGLCRVHAFRNSVCSTFFCLKDHGDIGDNFWVKAQTLGTQVESALSQWALIQVGFDMEAYIKRYNSLARKIKKVADPKTGGWREEFQQELWGDWADRKIELYLATAQVISDNRQHLWDIANSQEIMEATSFDKAMIKMVPKELQDQVEDDDLEEDGETVPPRDLWRRCLQSYNRLWDLKYGSYRLAKRVAIRENQLKTAEELFYKDQPYYIEFRTSSRSKMVESRLFISKEEKLLLEQFIEVNSLNWQIFDLPEAKKHADARGFFAEMIASRVLVKVGE